MFMNPQYIGLSSLITFGFWLTIAIFALLTFLRIRRKSLLLCSLGALLICLQKLLIIISFIIYIIPPAVSIPIHQFLTYYASYILFFNLLYYPGLLLFTLGLTLHILPLLRTPKPTSTPT